MWQTHPSARHAAPAQVQSERPYRRNASRATDTRISRTGATSAHAGTLGGHPVLVGPEAEHGLRGRSRIARADRLQFRKAIGRC